MVKGQGLLIMVGWIFRLLLAGIFVYAGIVKSIRPDAFLSDIESFRMMPYWMAWLVAFYLPPLEVALGVGLLLRRFLAVSSWLLMGLTGVFIAALVQAWLRGLDVSCGCFGTGAEGVNYIWSIGRDFLIFLTLLLLRMIPNNE